MKVKEWKYSIDDKKKWQEKVTRRGIWRSKGKGERRNGWRWQWKKNEDCTEAKGRM